MDISSWENELRGSIQYNVDLISSYLKNGDVYVDVGANTGLLTNMIIEKMGEKNLSKVILFEPVPYLAEECRKKFIGRSDIIVNEFALSDTTGETTILASNTNLGYNKIYKDGMAIMSHEKYTIHCETFTTWAKENNIYEVDFVKIDAEGHDVNVIRGMIGWLHTTLKKPYILFEVNWYPNLEEELVIEMQDLFGYTAVKHKQDILLVPSS